MAHFLAACTFGPRMESLPVAHGPEGARVAVTAHSGRYLDQEVGVDGELLEAREDGLLLLTGPRPDPRSPSSPTVRRLVLVRYGTLREAKFPKVRRPLAGGKTPPTDELEKLRRISRFPQGLQPGLMEALLRDCGQPEVEVWHP